MTTFFNQISPEELNRVANGQRILNYDCPHGQYAFHFSKPNYFNLPTSEKEILIILESLTYQFQAMQ